MLEARDLIAKDTYMMGMVKGKSDPYAVLRVGNIHFQSKTIQENLHPRWNEVYEVGTPENPPTVKVVTHTHNRAVNPLSLPFVYTNLYKICLNI